MVAQYPDIVNITWKGKPYQNEEGKWVQPSEGGIFSGKCRAVPATSDRRKNSQAGIGTNYQYDVYMPKIEIIIPEGANVEIVRHDGSLITGTAKNPINNQFNSRLWV